MAVLGAVGGSPEAPAGKTTQDGVEATTALGAIPCTGPSHFEPVSPFAHEISLAGPDCGIASEYTVLGTTQYYAWVGAPPRCYVCRDSRQDLRPSGRFA